jgi:serine O-acetyltransferase
MTEIGDDPVWDEMRKEARHDAEHEPILASFLYATILNHKTLERALACHLASKLACPSLLPPLLLMELFCEAFEGDEEIQEAIRADIRAVRERDPACSAFSIPFLYFKGYQALQSFRVAHWLYRQGRRSLALALQSRISEVFAVDIHPAARIGKGILFDHATGIVVGETAVIKDNVSILHEVTLGGTGKETGDRHPKIGEGVLIGAGTKILGNVIIGDGAKIGASSVVLEDIPAHVTAVGVPAKVTGRSRVEKPALVMDHRLDANGSSV